MSCFRTVRLASLNMPFMCERDESKFKFMSAFLTNNISQMFSDSLWNILVFISDIVTLYLFCSNF